MPHNRLSHTKDRMIHILKCLSRTGLKMGGTNGTKGVFAQRLAHWLQEVIRAGRYLAASDDSDDEGVERKPKNRVLLRPHTGGAVDVPDDAHVTPEQAESALGRAQATEHDDSLFEELDHDQKEEEMALMGRLINPPGVSYDCLAFFASP